MNKKNIVRVIITLTSFLLYFPIPNDYLYLKSGVVYLLISILLINIKKCKNINRKNIKENIFSYFLGISIGLLLIGSIIIILLLANKITINKNTFNIMIILLFSLFWVVQSFFEEYLFRSVLFDLLGKELGYLLTMLITSLIFALVHIGNESISILSLINIFIFGCFCGILMKQRKNIFLVSGIHFIWNYIQGNILGIEVSGNEVNHSLFLTNSFLGEEIFHGGSFGLEGGIITTFILLLGVVVLLIINKIKNNNCKIKETYFIYNSLDNEIFLSNEIIKSIEINNEFYEINNLMAISIIKTSKFKLLSEYEFKEKNIIFDLSMIDFENLDKEKLVLLLQEKELNIHFSSSKYILKSSLFYLLENT